MSDKPTVGRVYVNCLDCGNTRSCPDCMIKRVEVIEAEIDRAKRDADDAISTLRWERDRLRADLSDANARIDELEGDLGRCGDDERRLRAALESLRTECQEQADSWGKVNEAEDRYHEGRAAGSVKAYRRIAGLIDAALEHELGEVSGG